MSSTTAVKNGMADHWATLGNTYSLHTGDPGAGGTANEATGGGYTRQPTTWGAAVGGTVTGSQLVFQVVAGSYTHMCRWNGTTLLTVLDTPDAAVSPAGEVKVTPSYTYPSGAD
ncbi:phage tail fiber protein [Nocardia sp. CA-128927]|uniref:phage tail fiber protein n=1 Tax=Nocardia sp. CA-128927 TaxID=3239975 RepID=UPI003D951F25